MTTVIIAAMNSESMLKTLYCFVRGKYPNPNTGRLTNSSCGGIKYIKNLAIAQADQTIQGIYMAYSPELWIDVRCIYVFFQESLKATSYL